MISNLNIFLASAGTGKTHKLMDIVQKHLDDGVEPERIAFVTFTKAGATVAQLRAAEQFGFPLSRLRNFRTIHSMAFRGTGASRDRMMNCDRYKKFGEIANYDFGRLQLNAAEGIDWTKESDRRMLMLEQLYRQNREYAERIMDNRINHADLFRFMKTYAEFKKANGYTDFTDLLENYLAARLDEDVDVVCLDEMQDSSPLQWKVVFQAFRNAKAWYVAADQKQCIYGFSGASATTVLNLKGNIFRLDVSHRVPSNLLAFSEQIAGYMSVQDGIHCKSTRSGGELKYLVDMDELCPEFHADESYMFLCRNRKFFKMYEQWCQKKCLPYTIMGEPFPSMSDKVAWRDGNLDNIPKERLLVLQDYAEKGTLYRSSNIRISTIHGVKGDEADNVVVMSDMSRLSYKDMSIDEDVEHRVFYVAVTRAKKRLYIMQPTTKLYYPYLF